MKRFADAIFAAEGVSKQDQKHEALSGLEGDDLQLVYKALNPYAVFNVKKFTMPTAFATADASYDSFFELLDQLETRELSGNAAKAAITAILGQYTEKTAQALSRVLIKNLRCGATASTFSKLYPDLKIPSFEIKGAEKIDAKYKWVFPCIGEAKYDGRRLITLVRPATQAEITERSKGAAKQGLLFDEDEPSVGDASLKWSVVSYARSGNVAEYVEGIFDDELIKIAEFLGHGYAIDGESLSTSFQDTGKAYGSKNVEQRQALKYYVFDIMHIDEWDARSCPIVQEVRSNNVEALVSALKLTKLVKSKSKTLHNMAEAHAFYAEVLEDGTNEDGTKNGRGEGLMIKRNNGLYAWDINGSRSDAWVKWKPVLDFDLTITGFYRGDAGTKNEDKLGGLTLEGFDENKNPIKTNCGGFKVSHPKMKPLLAELAKKAGVQFDSEKKPNFVKNKDQFLRQYIWDHQDEFLGKVAMVEAQEMCLAEGETVYALRFAQFVTVRDDK